MSAGLAASAARARALRDFRRGNRRSRRRPSVYQLYVVVLCSVLGGLFAGNAISAISRHGLSAGQLSTAGPAALLLLMLLAMRFGVWHGPVSFSRADTVLLLTAPIAIALLVRPKLDRALLIGAVAGAAVGALTIVLTREGTDSPLRILGTVLSGAAFAAGLIAVSWLVQSHRRTADRMRSCGPLLPLLAVGLLGLSMALGNAVLWIGPWGWTLAPLVGNAAWPVALALLLGCSTALIVAARARAGHVDVESFSAGAGTRSGLLASVMTLDYRSTFVTYRNAASGAIGIRSTWLPRPRRARSLIPWRDLALLTGDLSRPLWAIALTVAGSLEAVFHPGRLIPALLATGAVYMAATLLCEPARVDVDSPERLQVLSPRRYGQVLVEHALVPAAIVSGASALTLIGVVIAGCAPVACLALIPAVIAPGTAITALAAVTAAQRGGRVDETLMTRLLSQDLSNPGGAAIAAFLLLPLLTLTLLAVGVPVALIGHALAHHAGAVVTVLPATAVMVCVAAALVRLGLHTHAGENA